MIYDCRHFTRNNNPLAEASGAGLSDTPAASTAGFSRLRMNHPIDQVSTSMVSVDIDRGRS